MRTHTIQSTSIQIVTVIALSLFSTPGARAIELQFLGRIDSAAATGTISYDGSANTILTTNEELKIQIHDFADGTNLALAAEVDLSQSVESARFVSGVAADPIGRGFGVATVIPTTNDSVFGKAVFFDSRTGEILTSLDVGFNPDSVSFHPDGNKLLVANEAEPGANSDPEGSISVIDLSSITTMDDLANLESSMVSTWDFSEQNLASDLNLGNLRVDPANAGQPHLDLEPESIVAAGDKAYVTLQENNAIGVFDLVSNQWTAIHSLGTIEQLIDASDRDGADGEGAAMIDDLVHGLPQPDGIIAFQSQGVTYVATANEGDARADFDFADHGIEGNPLIDADALTALSERYTIDPDQPANPADDALLGRLGISPIDGDTDGDGDIDVPTMYGTRSFSIWNSETGDLVFDSGSAFEEITLAEVPTLFNSDGRESRFDGRSDNKGVEPEAIVLGEIDESSFAFVGLERTGGIMMYDITDIDNVKLVDYLNTHLETGSRSPEGIHFISSEDSFDGKNYLIVGYDESSSIEVFAISLALTPGDFDGNGVIDLLDINSLTMEVQAGTNTVSFDLNEDGLVTDADRRIWIEDIKGTYLGDSNLDGEFNTRDLVDVFQKNQYEDGIVGNSTWETGDWNGDTEFNTSDLVDAFQTGGYEKGPRNAAQAVPEPNTVWLFAAGILIILKRRRRGN